MIIIIMIIIIMMMMMIIIIIIIRRRRRRRRRRIVGIGRIIIHRQTECKVRRDNIIIIGYEVKYMIHSIIIYI